METRNIAIMLTDIKGFTSKTAGFSRAETQELLSKHRELVLPVILKFHGRLVKTIGDAFLVAFDSPTDAVICGVEIQVVLKDHNADKSHGEKIEIRIAINSGEVAIHDDGDIYGDAVNITSRLESIAEAGEVFFTEAVYLSMNKKEVPSSEIGYRQFKGVAEKIKVYRVLREVPVGKQGQEALPPPEAAAAPAAPAAEKTAGFGRRLVSLFLDVCIFTMAIGMLGVGSCGPHVKVEAGDKYFPKEFTAGKMNIDKKGITLQGDNGEIISINQDGVKMTDPAHPEGRLERTKKVTAGLDTGLGQSRKKRVPLKMILWAVYCGILIWRFGATPGMMILKLKVVDAASGAGLGPDKAFLRSFFSLVSVGALLLGYAWAAWERNGRTWHDLIAGTKVVKL